MFDQYDLELFFRSLSALVVFYCDSLAGRTATFRSPEEVKEDNEFIEPFSNGAARIRKEISDWRMYYSNLPDRDRFESWNALDQYLNGVALSYALKKYGGEAMTMEECLIDLENKAYQIIEAGKNERRWKRMEAVAAKKMNTRKESKTVAPHQKPVSPIPPAGLAEATAQAQKPPLTKMASCDVRSFPTQFSIQSSRPGSPTSSDSMISRQESRSVSPLSCELSVSSLEISGASSRNGSTIPPDCESASQCGIHHGTLPYSSEKIDPIQGRNLNEEHYPNHSDPRSLQSTLGAEDPASDLPPVISATVIRGDPNEREEVKTLPPHSISKKGDTEQSLSPTVNKSHLSVGTECTVTLSLSSLSHPNTHLSEVRKRSLVLSVHSPITTSIDSAAHKREKEMPSFSLCGMGEGEEKEKGERRENDLATDQQRSEKNSEGPNQDPNVICRSEVPEDSALCSSENSRLSLSLFEKKDEMLRTENMSGSVNILPERGQMDTVPPDKVTGWTEGAEEREFRSMTHSDREWTEPHERKIEELPTVLQSEADAIANSHLWAGTTVPDRYLPPGQNEEHTESFHPNDTGSITIGIKFSHSISPILPDRDQRDSTVTNGELEFPQLCCVSQAALSEQNADHLPEVQQFNAHPIFPLLPSVDAATLPFLANPTAERQCCSVFSSRLPTIHAHPINGSTLSAERGVETGMRNEPVRDRLSQGERQAESAAARTDDKPFACSVDDDPFHPIQLKEPRDRREMRQTSLVTTLRGRVILLYFFLAFLIGGILRTLMEMKERTRTIGWFVLPLSQFTSAEEMNQDLLEPEITIDSRASTSAVSNSDASPACSTTTPLPLTTTPTTTLTGTQGDSHGDNPVSVECDTNDTHVLEMWDPQVIPWKDCGSDRIRQNPSRGRVPTPFTDLDGRKIDGNRSKHSSEVRNDRLPPDKTDELMVESTDAPVELKVQRESQERTTPLSFHNDEKKKPGMALTEANQDQRIRKRHHSFSSFMEVEWNWEPPDRSSYSIYRAWSSDAVARVCSRLDKTVTLSRVSMEHGFTPWEGEPGSQNQNLC